jgi:glycine cleavage system aminomethyltransferase T
MRVDIALQGPKSRDILWHWVVIRNKKARYVIETHRTM